MADPNIEMLRLAVEQLGELADELVFVGGSTAGLFITDEASADVRATKDVDAIVEAATYATYAEFEKRLRSAQFVHDTSEDAPMCRWIKGDTVFDLLPLKGEILGFENSWYREAFATATPCQITETVTIRVVTPVYFLATKLEAFTNRGNKDYLGSSDLEDIIAVINGREEIIDEIKNAPDNVRKFISQFFDDLLAQRSFTDALPGHLNPDVSRISIVRDRLKQIAVAAITVDKKSDYK
jgi:predicted nucleotidyltransferase